MSSIDGRSTGRRRLVLLGAGHAHLHTIQRTAEFTRRGFEVTVVAPENFWYSGLATGVLGGRYAPEEDQVDIESMVRAGGGKFLRERVSSINAASRTVQLGSGELSYDVLSINLGSETRLLQGEDDRVFPIKPLHHLWMLRQKLEASRAAGGTLRVVVAGGGPSGCEVAANIRALLGPQAGITLVAAGREIASSLSPSARKVLVEALSERKISIRCETTITRVSDKSAETSCGGAIPFDYLVNATGLHAPEMLQGSGFAVSNRGELLVDEYLRSLSDECVFAGGDCMQFGERGLPKVGVYAVRQAPVLYHNLLAILEGRRFLRFQPQADFLLILNLGAGHGLACYRNWVWQGRVAFWVKDWIDRRFLSRCRTAAR